MARIRNIKPDFWTDEKLVELEPVDRLLFIGIWNFADDEGYLPYSPKRIKMQVFPGDSLEISRGLQNLISAGVLTLYRSGSGEVLYVTNWVKHQKVSNPTKSKYSSMDLVKVGQEPLEDGDFGIEIPESSVKGTEISRELRKEREGEREREREVKTLARSAPLPSGFEKFWQSYPRKTGKAAAITAYKKALKSATPDRILSGLETLRMEVAGKDPQFTPYPASWLNAGRWEDERPPERPQLTVAPQYAWANR